MDHLHQIKATLEHPLPPGRTKFLKGCQKQLESGHPLSDLQKQIVEGMYRKIGASDVEKQVREMMRL